MHASTVLKGKTAIVATSNQRSKENTHVAINENTQSQLVLSQNQHALIQDTTKGIVQVYAGPHSGAVSQNERPVVYDRTKDEYVGVNLQSAVRQNPLVAEGEYLVLENPVLDKDGRLQSPTRGGNAPADLRIGSKINVPGPLTFPLWPGQFATVIPGHHLRSNQYLIVRVYNSDEAVKNATELLRAAAFPDADPESTVRFTPGELIVIKGTEASFFIPPTGFEVLKENNEYIREALTLERLEYAILLDENGNKRYERGPQVVFPEATERFVTRNEEKDGQGGKSRKFKAIELNDQMGLYIKVIADYDEALQPLSRVRENEAYDGPTVGIAGEQYRAVHRSTGEELFITGKEQRIYYPRPEHALIGYDDPKGGFKRERYYGITIPKGEGRYVLDKTAGDIKTVLGPQIFLPDPRNQVVVRRVLDSKTCALWYPGNAEAEAFNASLRALSDEAGTILADSAVQQAAADVGRAMNRMTAQNVQYASRNLGSFVGAEFSRGGKFTPPPMLTLSNKYDGVPTINVWTGYAVQVVDKVGNRRVVTGPATVLLQYDETLEMLTLSTGRPKTTDNLIHDVYLRVDNNLVSDLVSVETKDLVTVKVKLSYRVNFLREQQDKWFAVENYVKYLCDHMRSKLKAQVKKLSIREFIDDNAAVVRDSVLGPKSTYIGPETGTASDISSTRVARRHFFSENGMEVYDVELLGVEIPDQKVNGLLTQAQVRAVEGAITLTADEQNLLNMRRKTEIELELLDLGAKRTEHTYAVQRAGDQAKADVAMAALEAAIAEEAKRLEAEVKAQTSHDAVAAAELARDKARSEHALSVASAQTGHFRDRMAAITPRLISALQAMGDRQAMLQLSNALAPLALHEQQGLGQTMERVFKGTPLEPLLKNMQTRMYAATVNNDEDDNV